VGDESSIEDKVETEYFGHRLLQASDNPAAVVLYRSVQHRSFA
jgi:hypothetical protein